MNEPGGPVSLARALARFACNARDDDFPGRAREMAVDAITDCIGCMLAGSREPVAAIVTRTLASIDEPNRGVALLGTPARASVTDSALYHGSAAHALDYDDTNHPAYAHPSAVVVPAMLAIAPLASIAGRDAVTAYILGVEVFGKLGRALNNDHYLRGWHATATFGALAACVAAGRLLRLSEPQQTMAIGIAASAAGGLRANFGTMVKPLHAGLAARNGVLAALLAREGLTASEGSLDHRYGFVNVFNDGLVRSPEALTWGMPLEITTEYGLALKPYPSCGATHTAIEAAIRLHERIAGRGIASVHAGVSKLAFAPLIHRFPQQPLEGKFSLHFCVAIALLEGRVDLSSFSTDKVADPRVRNLMPRIEMEAEPRFDRESEFPTALRVDLVDGDRVEETVVLARGKPERWFSREELEAKFIDCASPVVGEAVAGRAFRRLAALEDAQSLHAVVDLLLGENGA
jgi:2-methylcitrate dehydratase PrpD